MQTVQEKNTDNYRFFSRAKNLQKKAGFISDEQLAALIGISAKTYYNSIKLHPITAKTWEKLAAAEAKLEISNAVPSLGTTGTKNFPALETTARVFREPAAHYGAERTGALRATIKTLRTQLDELERLLEEKP